MAKSLVFDRKHFNSDGLIPLKRGDDWSLDFKVVEKKGSYVEDVNLTDLSATAWFPGESSPVTCIPTITDASCGKGRIDLPASATSLVKEALNGTTLYITLSNTGGAVTTVETDQEVAEVRDRDFRQF